MSDLLSNIETKLNNTPIKDNLVPLFCESLLWGRANAQSFDRDVNLGNDQPVNLRINPIAQLSGLPILQADWPMEKPPNVTQRRAVHSALSQTHLEHVLIYTTPNGKEASFVWAQKRKDNKIELRSLPYEVDQPARTTIEQLGKIAFSVQELSIIGDPGISVVTDKLKAAFDVEMVTRQFFRQYAEIFRELESSLTNQINDDDERHMFTQRLFNRLLFLCFLQKRGWLNSNRGYLFSLFDSAKSEGLNFYDDYLFFLLFCGLNNNFEKAPPDFSREMVNERIGEVPFLNGGLFEINEPWDSLGRVSIENDIFSLLLGIDGLLRRFNFTIMESTPLDVEVAVDPEMLGKVFEELVTGRHETGSYYTPQPVVSFMCKEALIGYLSTRFSKQDKEVFDDFVHNRIPEKISDPESVLDALRTITICDPACGSGAYLLGILHELLDLREALFVKHEIDYEKVFDRKLEIIKHNIYGVDIDEFAVEIAKLRLWLSLIVDCDKPLPLPNLDFKIGVGDSLTAPNPEGGLELGFRKSNIDKLKQEKENYLESRGKEKQIIKTKITTLRTEIQSWSGYSLTDDTFDWIVDFAEIFASTSQGNTTLTGAMTGLVNTATGQMEFSKQVKQTSNGFDIVIANPPYVRADAQFRHIKDNDKRQSEIQDWKSYRKRLKRSKVYSTLYEKWDMYIPFLERAYQLLGSNGHMVYIISDAYNAAKYAIKSHIYFLENCCIRRIDFCSDIPIFDAGVFNTILYIQKNNENKSNLPTRIRRWGDKPEDFEDNIEELSTHQQMNYSVELFRPDSNSQIDLTTDTIELENICYISYGLRANADDRYWQGEFTTKDCMSPTQDEIHPKLFVQGKDLTKWFPERIWYLEWGTDRAPAKFSRKTFPELHNASEKIISMRTPGALPRSIYDNKKIHYDASSVGFVPWFLLEEVVNRSISKSSQYKYQNPHGDREYREKVSRRFQLKYLLAIMNSSFSRDWLATKRRSNKHIYPDDWKALPIPNISEGEQSEFSKLVDMILNTKKSNQGSSAENTQQIIHELERRIDDKVSQLFLVG